jgi:hypothetical protein
LLLQITCSDCSKNLDLKSKTGVDQVFNQRSSLNHITTVLAPFLVSGYIGSCLTVFPPTTIFARLRGISVGGFLFSYRSLLSFSCRIKKRSDIKKTTGTGTRFAVYTCASHCSEFLNLKTKSEMSCGL